MDIGSKKETTFLVSDDELVDDRSPLTVFFQVLVRKFWKLISLNLLTVLFNLPAFAFVLFLAMYMMQVLMPSMFVSGDSQELMSYLLVAFVPIMLVALSVPVITTGPAQAGLAYLLRNYFYENPTFLWYDFITKAKENFKQSMIVGTINIFVFLFALVDLYLYRSLAQGNQLLMIANGLLLMAFLIFIMMCLYIWPMMVTYRLTIKQLYKNAFLFAVGRFLPNLLALFLVIVAAYGPFFLASLTNNVLVMGGAYVYQLLLGLTLPGLILHFFINPMMDKFMQPEVQEDATPEQ